MLCFKPPEVTLHDGRDVGVNGRGAHPLVFLELREYLVRERDGDFWKLATDGIADVLLVGRVGVGMEEAYGYSIDVGVLDAADDVVERLAFHGRQHLSGVEHPLLYLETQVAGHQRVGAADAPVVEVGPVLPADLQDIAEARGNDQGSLCALALKEGVRGYRRPVNEEVDPVG